MQNALLRNFPNKTCALWRRVFSAKMKSAFSTWLSTNYLSTRGFFRHSPAIEKKMTATKLLALMSQALVDELLMKFEVFRNGALEEG